MIDADDTPDRWDDEPRDGRGVGARPCRRGVQVPPPYAPIGTLLELVQLAHHRHPMLNVRGDRNGKPAPANACLCLAETHASVLIAASATHQQREFVIACENPWSAILAWCDDAMAAQRRPQEVA